MPLTYSNYDKIKMKNIVIAILILITLFINHSASAQRAEIGIIGGGSYYLGDLNPKKNFELTQPAAGLLVRYNLNPRFAVKVNGIIGNVKGDDAITKFNEKRNLSFKSQILEFAAQLELNFLPYVTGHKDYYFSPYMFAGIAAFNFEPMAQYDGTWYSLQPLGTEGQGTIYYYDRKPYSLNAMSFPFGLGFKYALADKVCVGGEWGMRKTNTDYLDDVSTTYADPNILSAENTPVSMHLADRSNKLPGEPANTGLQRGNSTNKDWYSFAGLFVTFKITKKRKGDCPTYQQYKKYKDFYKD